jgi:hypothetical protein
MASQRGASKRRLVLLAALAVLSLSGCSSLNLAYVGMGVGSYQTTWAVGSCHRLDQFMETDLMYASDTSPPVPCTTPHQSETYADVPITGAVARQAERPSPLWLQSSLRGVCSWSKMASFLGDQPPDITRDIVVLQIIPSVPEWRAGVRRVRCDALIGPRTTESLATISQSLRNIVHTSAARFRVCRLGYTEVPCDGLHTAELVYPYIKFSAAELARDRNYMLDKVKNACQREVAAYVGAPLDRRPDLVLQPELPGDFPHRDSVAGHCWVAPASGLPVTGSVRRTGTRGAA